MSKRCSCFAITTSRICKKKFSFIIQGKKFCCLHAKYEFNKYAILIQKYWVGYKIRHMIKHIYSKLPYELQRKIIFYVRENYLIKKHHYNIISKILDKKLNKGWFLSTINSLKPENIVYQSENIHLIANIYYLYTKYIIIAKEENLILLKKNALDFRYYNVYNNNSDILELITKYINPFIDKIFLLQ